jgi:hypothetical protein
MAMLPRLLRPSVIIRRKAVYQGFLGTSRVWRAVGVVVFGKSTIKKFFGKRPELLDVSRLGPGRTMQIATIAPTSRRRRRRRARRASAVKGATS